MRKQRFILEAVEEDNLPDVVTDIDLELKDPIEDISKAEEEHFEDTVKTGLSHLLTDLIKDEWEAYEGYKSAIEMFKTEGVEVEIVNVLEEILGEELVHIGQLQKCLELVEPQAAEIPEGEKEAKKQLAGEEGHVDEELTETLELRERNLKESINYNDVNFKEGYSIDIASVVENIIENYLDWDDPSDEEFNELKEMYRNLTPEEQTRYCNYISNRAELGDYTWDCIYEDIRDQGILDQEVLQALLDGDVSSLQPMEIAEKLELKEGYDDCTLEIKNETDYRLRELYLADLEELSDLTEAESIMLNLSDESLDEIVTDVARRVYDDERVWEEICESIDYYISHYPLEQLQELQQSEVDKLKPLDIEEE